VPCLPLLGAMGRPVKVGILMTDDDFLYSPFTRRGSYFHRMIDCGCDQFNRWVQDALQYLPRDVLDKYKENIAFISIFEACRIAREYCEKREIILLSDRIFPKGYTDYKRSEDRYFIFTVLHEVAHVIKKHKSMRFDNLTGQENRAQEDEADLIALKWFNEHIERNNFSFKPITIEEINDIRQENQVKIKANLLMT
jgi:hypothetical protein